MVFFRVSDATWERAEDISFTWYTENVGPSQPIPVGGARDSIGGIFIVSITDEDEDSFQDEPDTVWFEFYYRGELVQTYPLENLEWETASGAQSGPSYCDRTCGKKAPFQEVELDLIIEEVDTDSDMG